MINGLETSFLHIFTVETGGLETRCVSKTGSQNRSVGTYGKPITYLRRMLNQFVFLLKGILRRCILRHVRFAHTQGVIWKCHPIRFISI